MRIYSPSVRNDKFYQKRLVNGVPSNLYYSSSDNDSELEGATIADSIELDNSHGDAFLKVYTIAEDVEMVYVATVAAPNERLAGIMVKAEDCLNYVYNLNPGGGEASVGYTTIRPIFRTFVNTPEANTISIPQLSFPIAYFFPEGYDAQSIFSFTANSVAYDWFDASDMGTDVIFFYKTTSATDDIPADMATTQYTCELAQVMTDIGNLDGIYSVADVANYFTI